MKKRGIQLDEDGDLKINVVRDEDEKIIGGLCIGKIDNPINAEFGDIEELSEAISPELPFYNEMKQEILKFRNEFTNEACKHNFEIATYQREKAQKLEIQNAELQHENNNLETTLTTNYKYLHKEKPQKEPANTLKPNITEKQINLLSKHLKGIVEATPEQWRALFHETEIQLSEPIKAVAVADIALLLVQLHRYKFIKAKEYAAIIGRVKAFSFEGKTITSKQINATKERSDWWKETTPAIGLNYSTINKAVASL
jgi:hypothetical protein